MVGGYCVMVAKAGGAWLMVVATGGGSYAKQVGLRLVVEVVGHSLLLVVVVGAVVEVDGWLLCGEGW